jgi:hypothetical protein
MKKLLIIALAVAVAISLGTGLTLAGDNIPSAKSAAFTTEVEGVGTSWTSIFPEDAVQIKTGDPKDLVITVSAECVLLTNSKLVGKDSTDSSASIWVRVVVDGSETKAVPGNVTFASRTVKIRGDLTHVYTDEVGPPLDDHWIELFIGTKTANSFQFIAQNVGNGPHTIDVQAAAVATGADTDPTDPINDPAYAAMIGYATVVVDEVNLKLPATDL